MGEWGYVLRIRLRLDLAARSRLKSGDLHTPFDCAMSERPW